MRRILRYLYIFAGVVLLNTVFALQSISINPTNGIIEGNVFYYTGENP